MYAVDPQIQCKVVSTYEVPHHNSSDNDFTNLVNNNSMTFANDRMKNKDIKLHAKGRCEQKVGIW
ncbi:hypothetical protein T4C_10157 [Trichinella pseudospiralis]|uniref:Uncharacterized protein n=1 Tax=Trichinella pseudospiralis TaxID=6337 RepID=A0A0V0XRJ8_TRIPS|nr:hypothetical protein T4E_1221 [Trichinella pseudospiralis]KRX90612.1 hypothetical protein T4E_3136 [Trichinella pseudospiralis]KRZ36719.1 hypothetical protein T4C_10157 [Trichinella pseudospiralis]